jgi:hypothetical protein
VQSFKAIKLALRNPVALIQGPLGTGKSYVGAKILELLLITDSLSPGPMVLYLSSLIKTQID